METLTALAIFALGTTIALPNVIGTTRRFAMRASAIRVAHLLISVRSRAASMNHHVAIRFNRSPDGWTYRIYEDGNGNGVSLHDIATGVDPLVEGPALLYTHCGSAFPGFPRGGVTDPDTGHPMSTSASPVAFGAHSLCSFAPQEGATPGTIYVTDGVAAAAVRCAPDGEVHPIWFEASSRRWSR